MKKLTLFFSLFSMLALTAATQEVIRVQSCNDTTIQKQADSLKKLFAKDGFEVLKEASLQMESEFEMPIIVPLQERSRYQVIFIGDMTSKLYEVRMYDYDDKMVTYQKKMWGDVDGNVISFPFIPQFSELYMIKPVQVNKKKKKGMCGYVMLLGKTKIN